MKKVILIFICMSMIFTFFTGCNSGNQSPAATASSGGSNTTVNESSKPKEITLQLALYGDDARKKKFEEFGKRFTEKNPGIKVEVSLVPFGEFAQKMAILLSSKNAPDVTWLSEKMVPQFLNSGSLVDISAIKEDPKYDFADMAPSSLEIYTRDGKVYGVPFSCGPRVFYYNKTLFQEKGLKTPDALVSEGKWTLDELYKTAKALTDKEKGVYGIKLFPATSPDDWINALYDIVWSYGADYFDADMTKFTLNTPQGIAAMQYYYDMLFKDGIHVKPGDLTQFESGKIGLARDFVSYAGQIRGKVNFDWDIAPNPIGPAGKDVKVAVGQANYSCFKGDHEAEAIELLKFFTSKEIMTELVSNFIPSRKSVLESKELLNQPQGKPTAEAMKLAVATPLSTPGSRALPAHPNFQQIDVEMKKLYDLMYTKSYSVKDIIGKMEKTVNPLLSTK